MPITRMPYIIIPFSFCDTLLELIVRVFHIPSGHTTVHKAHSRARFNCFVFTSIIQRFSFCVLCKGKGAKWRKAKIRLKRKKLTEKLASLHHIHTVLLNILYVVPEFSYCGHNFIAYTYERCT